MSLRTSTNGTCSTAALSAYSKGTTATVYEVPDSNHIWVLVSAASADATVSKKVLDFIHAQTAK